MKKFFWGLMVVLLIVLLAMFFSKTNDKQILLTDDDNDNVLPVDLVENLAVVEEVEIFMLESMPVQVKVVVRGSLPDGCTEIGEINQQLKGNTHSVEVKTLREEDRLCSQAEVPYSKTITLEDTVGLVAGEYVVDVNGVEASYTLDVDNVLRVSM